MGSARAFSRGVSKSKKSQDEESGVPVTVTATKENCLRAEKHAHRVVDELFNADLELQEVVLALAMASQIVKDFLASEGITYTCERKAV